MTETPEPVEHVDESNDVEDFDAFWQTLDRKGPRVRIMGETITLPASLPLQFELEARKVQRSKSEDDVRKLLSIIGFPDDAQARWAEAGMDLEQFQVLLAWAPRRIAGQPVTLAEVREQLRKAQQKAGAEGNGSGSPRRNRKRTTSGGS